MKKNPKKVVKLTPEIVKAPTVLTVKSAGLVNGEFVVVLSNGDFLGKVEEVSTKKVGYGNGVYVHKKYEHRHHYHNQPF